MARLKKTAIVVAAFVFVAAVLGHFVYRPWQMNWGATDEEILRVMPGDDVVDRPSFVATRAVTIDAPPGRIWPWLLQIGYKRAGFYSWDFLDNDRIPSAERILPEYQHLQEGDRLPLGKHSDAVVKLLETNKHLLLIFPDDSLATWVWGLYETETGGTRLITRLRVQAESTRYQFMLDYGEFVMMRRHMLGIKRRVESETRSGRDSLST